MLTIIAHLKIQAGKEAAVEKLVQDMAAATSGEAGTVAYLFLRSLTDPMGLTVVEMYRDKDSFDAHMAAPHVQNFMARMGDLFDATATTFDQYQRAAGFTQPS